MTHCDEQAVNFLYAAIGQLTFGAKMFEFETFSRSLDTLCLVPANHCTHTYASKPWLGAHIILEPWCVFAHSQSLLGEFPYDTMREVECVVGPVYFWSYICISFLLLLNVLLSIIVDTWTQVRPTSFTVPNSIHHA